MSVFIGPFSWPHTLILRKSGRVPAQTKLVLLIYALTTLALPVALSAQYDCKREGLHLLCVANFSALSHVSGCLFNLALIKCLFVVLRRSYVATVAKTQLLKPLRWVRLARRNRKQQLVLAFFKCNAHICHLLLYDLL